MNNAVDQLSEQQRRDLSGPTMIAFLEVSSDWRLSREEELACAGYPDPAAFQVWCEAALDDLDLCLPEDMLLRLGAICGVARSISALLFRKEDRLHWLRSPVRGPVCGGLSPLEIMSEPEDMPVVAFRQRLEDWTALPYLGGTKFRRQPDVPRRAPKTSVESLLALINGGGKPAGNADGSAGQQP